MILADENIDHSLIHAIRNAGFEVYSVYENNRGLSDEAIIDYSRDPPRIILTEDKDFGELVFRDRLNSHGVILLRAGKLDIGKRIQRLCDAWSVVEANPEGAFIVITETRIRVRPLALRG